MASTSKKSKIFLIILLTYTKCMHAKDQCPTRICNKSDPNTRKVRFPFRIRNDTLSGSCGYPGFDLFCNGYDKLSIELPNSGVFYVEAIDYVKQELLLNDPTNCLPKRLLSLNLSVNLDYSPFVAVQDHVYRLYNCSNDRLIKWFSNLNTIGCLSGSGYGVVASRNDVINDEAQLLSLTCDSIGIIRVPVGSESEEIKNSDLSGDIRLVWVKPDCGECLRQGGLCGFQPESSFEVGCFNLPRWGLSRNATIAIGLAIVTTMTSIFICISYLSIKTIRSRRTRNDASISITATRNASQPQSTGQISYNGLNSAIIESFPKLTLGESMRLPIPKDKNCAICLGEYLPQEALRVIPPCGHSFHAPCIDEWLLLNASCPICRNHSVSSHFNENIIRI